MSGGSNPLLGFSTQKLFVAQLCKVCKYMLWEHIDRTSTIFVLEIQISMLDTVCMACQTLLTTHF